MSAAATESTSGDLTGRKLILLTLINIFNYLDRYVVNAVLPLIAVQFALNHQQEGQVASAFVIGYTLFSPIFGVLGDRYRRPILMFIGVAIWSLATIFSGLASSFLYLIGARILVGVGEASFGVIAPGYIKDFEKDPIALNKKLALFYVAIPLGAALGYVLGGQVAAAYSWHAAFFIAAVPTILLALGLLAFPEIRRTKVHSSPVREVFALFKKPVLRLAQLGYVLNTFALTSLAAFIATYGVSIGFELSEINSSFGVILVVAGILGTAIGAKLSSLRAERAVTPVTGLLQFTSFGSLLGVPLLVTAFLVKDHTAFLLCTGLAELLIFASLAPINTVLVLSAPPALVTLTQGLTILLINIFGALAGPLLVGLAADKTSLALGLQLSSVAMFGCGLVWWYASTVAAKQATFGLASDSPVSRDSDNE